MECQGRETHVWKPRLFGGVVLDYGVSFTPPLPSLLRLSCSLSTNSILCSLLFSCSTICCAVIWRRQKRSTAGLQKLDG